MRQGRFPQGRGCECQQRGSGLAYDPLGVLGVIYAEATGDDPFVGLAQGKWAVNDRPAKWLGLSPAAVGEMVNRNDLGQSFEGVAQWVETL